MAVKYNDTMRMCHSSSNKSGLITTSRSLSALEQWEVEVTFEITSPSQTRVGDGFGVFISKESINKYCYLYNAENQLFYGFLNVRLTQHVLSIAQFKYWLNNDPLISYVLKLENL
jgi:hypothetical protein